MRRRRRRHGWDHTVVLATALVLGIIGYAYTNSNGAGGAHAAGASSSSVSGYVVTVGPEYVFAANGSGISGVRMTLDQQASDVAVALSASAPTSADWVDCGPSATSAPYTVSCSLPVVATTEVLQFSMAAVEVGHVGM